MNVPITLANGNTVELNNIVESGNDYVRFSDGTQIYWGSTGIYSKTFPSKGSQRCIIYYTPKKFKAYITSIATINNVQPTSLSTETKANFKIMSCGGSSDNLYIEVYNGNSESMKASVYLDYISIGRWK